MRAAAGRGDRRDGGSRRAEFNDKIEREKAVFKESRLYYETKAKLLTWSAILLTTLAALGSVLPALQELTLCGRRCHQLDTVWWRCRSARQNDYVQRFADGLVAGAQRHEGQPRPMDPGVPDRPHELPGRLAVRGYTQLPT